jgi:hypothetical protein
MWLNVTGRGRLALGLLAVSVATTLVGCGEDESTRESEEPVAAAGATGAGGPLAAGDGDEVRADFHAQVAADLPASRTVNLSFVSGGTAAAECLGATGTTPGDNVDPRAANFEAMDTECAQRMIDEALGESGSELLDPRPELSGYQVTGSEDGFTAEAESASGTVFTYRFTGFEGGGPSQRVLDSRTCSGESPGCIDSQWQDIDREGADFFVTGPYEG